MVVVVPGVLVLVAVVVVVPGVLVLVAVVVVMVVVVPGVLVLVAVVVVMVVVVPVIPYDPLDPLARVDHQRLRVGDLEILKPALEPYAVDHDDVGCLHALEVAERRLPVVRLDAARNQH